MPDLVLVGDVMMGRKVARSLEDQGPGHVWGAGIVEALQASDAAVGNFECVVAETGQPEPGRTFHFRAPPTALEALEQAGFDGVTIANNHVLDFGDEALLEMLDRLEASNLVHAGSGRSIEEAWRPAQFEVGDLDVAILAFTDNVPTWSIERRRPGVAYAPTEPGGAQMEAIEREVEGLAHRADVVVVSAHWGPNMRRQPPEGFQQIARGLIDAGADVFWGHSAHLFQAIERYREGLILYDTGDFLDDYRIHQDERNDISFLFRVHLVRGRVGRLELEPVRIDPRRCLVRLADASAASLAADRMRELSEPFGTRLEQEEGQLVVPVEEPRST